MKNLHLLLLTLILTSSVLTYSFGQISPEWSDTTFLKNYPSQAQQFDMVTDLAGNVYVSCYIYDTSLITVSKIVKYNTFGVKQWVYTIDSSHYRQKLHIDSFGNLYIGGIRDYFASLPGMHIVKLDTFGNVIWENNYSIGEWAHDIVSDSLGNLYVASTSYPAFLTMKIDPFGNLLWATPEDTTQGLTISHIKLDNSNNVYYLGRGWDSTYNCKLFKYDNSGTKIWERTYQSNFVSGYSAPIDMIVHNENVYLLSGTGYLPLSQINLAVIKYDTSGTFIWQAIYTGVMDRVGARAFDIDDSGNVFATGDIYPGNCTNDSIVTLMFDDSGALSWLSTFSSGLCGWDRPVDLEVDPAGNIYVIAESPDTITGISTFTTLKYDNTGTLLWDTKFNIPSEYSIPNNLSLDPSGNIYLSGNSSVGGGLNTSILTLKYSFLTELNEINLLDSDVSVFPNPFQEYIIVPSKLLGATFQLFDVYGKLVFSIESIESLNITLPRYKIPNGIYLYRISTIHEIINQGKIIGM